MGGRSFHFWILTGLGALGLIWLILLLLAIKPPRALELQSQIPAASAAEQTLTFAWPERGNAAIGMDGAVKAGVSAETARPIASMAKIITALVILEGKPLGVGDVGPSIVMTADDVALYDRAVKDGQSNLKVSAGQSITEKQMLEGLLLVSANNLADSLAIWAYGSIEDYVTAANNWLRENNLRDTVVADASGFSSQTVSTANDMVALAMKADGHAVLRGIFSAKTAQFPSVGEIKNTNLLLGIDGIYGLKTGHTDDAGANLLFASKINVKGEEKNIYGVVMGQADDVLFDVAKVLNRSAQENVDEVVIVPAGTVVGRILSQWGESTQLLTVGDLTIVGWKDEVETSVSLDIPDPLLPLPSKKVVGKAMTSSDETDIVAELPIREPSFAWKVLHF
ncbi:MAG: hypothetical protein LBK50_03355 [Candidatus Nomurabacteria bacterium]|jgi:D-alanyl-D-alanine carboxypeptidase (penicillin-binding protein 5/6)|nr:hypothetical protein [Candidatus Nomurabacteria bacterium]